MVDDICDVYNCIICNYVTSIRKDYRRHLGTSKHIRNVEADVDIETQMFACEACKYVTTNRKDYKRHMVTTKHIKNTDFTPVPEPQKFVCETCEYVTTNWSNYNRHTHSKKHATTVYMETFGDAHLCVCGRVYKHKQSIYKHRRTCVEHINMKADIDCGASDPVCTMDSGSESVETAETAESDQTVESVQTAESVESDQTAESGSNNMATDGIPLCIDIDNLDDDHIPREAYIKLVNQLIDVTDKNNRLVETVMTQQDKINDIIPKIGNTTNNQVNINVFLNEKCKDAPNIMDFVNSIQLQLKDLENTGKIGYVDSISNLLIDELNQMKITERPIHCTDGKRDVLYVKDNDVWGKESGDNEKMKRAIRRVNTTNSKQIATWMAENPECSDGDSAQNATYMKILDNTVVCDDEDKKVRKIIKNVARSVILDKDTCMVVG